MSELSRFSRIFGKSGPKATILVFFPFVLIIALSTLATTLVLYLFFTNSTAELLSQRTLEGLHSSQAVFSRIHLGSFPSFLHLDEDPDIHDYLAYPASKINALKALVKIDKVASENSLVDSIFLCNPEAGVLSTRFGWEKLSGRSDPDLPALLENIRQIGLGRYIPRQASFGSAGQPANLYTIIFGNLPAPGNAMRKAVVVNLSETRIRALLEPRNPQALSQIVILDQRNGIILTHPQANLFGKAIAADQLLSTVARQEGAEGALRLDDPTGSFILTWSDQADMGWRFVSLSAEDKIFGPLRSIRDVAILVALIVLLTSFTFAVVAAVRLDRQLTRQQHVASFLRSDSLDNHEPHPDRLFGGDGPWLASLVKIDGYRRLSLRTSESHARKQAEQLGHLATRIFGKLAVCRMEDHVFLLLERPTESNTLLDELRQAFSRTDAPTLSVLRHRQPVLSADLPHLWRQVSEVDVGSFARRSGEVHDMADLVVPTTGEFDIDQLDLSRYENALRLDNGQEAARVLDQLMDKVAQSGNREIFRYLVSTLSYRTVSILGSDADLLLASGADGLRRDLSTAENLEDLRFSLAPVFQAIVKRAELHNGQRQRETVRRIKELVESSLADRGLGTAGLAKTVGLSAHYVRDIFKQVEGQSLSNWVGQRRIEAASRLLRETDRSVRDICDSTGFINYSYFFTYFKKATGQTPNDYRQSFRT